MKHTDPVIEEVWRAKEANAKKHRSLAEYLAYLRKQGKRKHAGGRIAAPANVKAAPRAAINADKLKLPVSKESGGLVAGVNPSSNKGLMDAS